MRRKNDVRSRRENPSPWARLPPHTVQQTAFIRQKYLTRVEVLQALQPVLAAIDADHAAVGDEQLAKLGYGNQLAAWVRQGATGPRTTHVLENCRIHVSLLPAIARPIFTRQIVFSRP